MGGFAWVTLATNDSYSLGALVLAHSLKAVGTAHQLAVLVTPGVTSAMREKLTAVFNLVQEVNILDSRDETNLRLLKRPELGITFTKLHCWRLTQYEKCVFLDADTLVLQYCDELFEREELSAAPDVGWPDCFNSGVFVYRPSLDTYENLIQFALDKGSFDGGDQGLLNLYFSDWAHKDISKHLPFIYNMCSTACYSYLPAFKQFGANAKIIHFIGAQKPWLQYFNIESRQVQPSAESSHLQEVLQRWWDIFCSLIHPHLSPSMPQGQLQHAVSPSYFPPQYAPPPNPISSADDYENAWDPWDEYDQKMAQSSHYTSVSSHLQNQPIESLNTNASHVADQPTIHSQPQSYNFSTYSAQNNSFYQPIPQPVSQHIPRMPTPPPSSQPQHHHQEPSYDQSQYHDPHPHHHRDPQYHHPEPQYHHPEPQHHDHEPQNHHSPSHFHHQEHHPPEFYTHHVEPHHHHVHHHHHQEVNHQNHPSHNHQPHNEHSQHSDNHRHHQNDHINSHETKAESFPLTHDLPSSPNRLDPMPILPKECEATTTVSNDMSLSSTIEDSSNQENAGLAGAFAQLTLGIPRTEEQDAFENLLRKQAWEVGNIDYLGKDSFDNIWSKISETLSSGPLQPPASAVEPESPAPAQSQSQIESATQEEAKSAETPVTSITTPGDTAVPTDNLKIDSESTIETPKGQQQVTQGSSETSEKPESQVEAASSTVSEDTKPAEISESRPLPDVSPAPKETESAAEPISESKEAETKASEPQIEVPKEETEAAEPQTDVPATDTKAPEPQTVVPATETKAPEPQTVIPATETKAPEPQTDVSAIETKATEPQTTPEAETCPIPQKKAVETTSKPEPTKEAEPVVEVCPLPDKKKTSKESEAQVTALQTEAVKETPSSQEEPQKTPKSQEAPTKAPQLQETIKEAVLPAAKEPAILPEPPIQPAEVSQQSEALPEELEASAPLADTTKAPSAISSKEESKPAPRKVKAAAESTAAPTESGASAKSKPSKDSPKTKVTEATPPATPVSPSVEKTKESLAAEASIPDTPPPSEGGSTPAPPPRKTDKPKKVAAKPKK